MLFHTWIFLVFFAAVWPVYLLVRGTRLQDPWLLAASYVFYGWWNPLYLLLIVCSTAIDYFAVLRMARSARRGLWLVLSLSSNLLLLGTFKYGDFLTRNVNALLVWLGLPLEAPSPGLLLPVGISFYTFQSMSYTIDYYRGLIGVEPSFVRFATYVSLFPQLVAGPIERARHLLPQLRGPAAVRAADVADGLSLFVVGLFKKLALADYLGLYVDRVYDAPGSHEAPALLAATFAFGWQIYFDFSGYTDMARGVARAMGFTILRNFRHPYLATSLGDFWRRWHISLSTWFRDYVYIPLGGSRNGALATYRNMVATMLIAGLWHGAAWTFVIWGALHALGRVATRALESTALYRTVVPTAVKQLGVFAFVTFTWIFFRADGIEDAWLIVSRIASPRWAAPGFPLLALLLILLAWAHQFVQESAARRLVENRPVRVGLAALMILYLALVPMPAARPFIYFQF